MVSPLQVLFYFAVTLAPAGTHHVTVSGGDEVYAWDKGSASDDADTWVYDWKDVDPKCVLKNNDIVPDDFVTTKAVTTNFAHRRDNSRSILYFDPQHQLQKTSQGYVYLVRPGAPNEKFYSFKFE